MTYELLVSNDWSRVKPCGALGIVSCKQHLEVTNTLKKLKTSQLENLDDASIILMPMFVTCK